MESNRQQCAGGIVLGDGGTIALVRNRPDTRWFFPKGKREEGEDDEGAARREIEEEAGLDDLELIADLGTYERPHIRKDGTYDSAEIKAIHMFLFADNEHRMLAPTMEIESARWVPYREVALALEDAHDRAWFISVFERVREAIQRD